MAVRSNIAKSSKNLPAAPAEIVVVNPLREHAAALCAALLDNNRGEAARVFARARHAGIDHVDLQRAALDANCSGALMKQALVLSRDITAADLSKGNAAVNALAEGARKQIKRERDAKASVPLKVPMFAGLIVR